MLKLNISDQVKKNIGLLALGAGIGATAYYAVRTINSSRSSKDSKKGATDLEQLDSSRISGTPKSGYESYEKALQENVLEKEDKFLRQKSVTLKGILGRQRQKTRVGK